VIETLTSAELQARREAAATLAPVAVVRPPRRRYGSRVVVAGPAGIALLLAGGALLVRVAVLTAAGQGAAQHTWLYTAAACVLAGLALAIIAAQRLAHRESSGADEPDPAEPRG
jgi:hypothetical protein